MSVCVCVCVRERERERERECERENEIIVESRIVINYDEICVGHTYAIEASMPNSNFSSSMIQPLPKPHPHTTRSTIKKESGTPLYTHIQVDTRSCDTVLESDWSLLQTTQSIVVSYRI